MKKGSRFSSEDLGRWKREINPAPIISARVPLRRENTEWIAACPFHEKVVGHIDKTPSFKVYKLGDGTWCYKCFGCGVNGNVFQFVQQFDAIPFAEAVDKVLVEAGLQGWVSGEEQTDTAPSAEITPKASVTFPMAHYAPTMAALERSAEAQKWLAARGISMATARKFCLGFVQSAEKITSHNAWVKDGWVLFPTLSADRQTVTAVKYRSLAGKKAMIDGRENSGILRAPNTATTLFNLLPADLSGDVWLAEGEPDTLVLAQAGLAAVGLPMAGYDPTEEECERLSTAKRRFFAGDTDSAGVAAMGRLQKRLRGAVYVIKWPHNRKDANDVLTNECENDPAKFKVLVEDLRERVTQTQSPTIQFHTPARSDPDGEYVIAPAENQEDGWFPLGDISLIGGASGTGKTTFIFEMLHKQKQGYPVLEHRTHKYLFHVLAYDRGRNAFTRTMRRLKLNPVDIPTTPLPLVFGTSAVQSIINQIEALSPTPSVIFIEGLDMLIDDTNKKSVVSPFMRQLQEVAAHFHIALIGSLGAPKTKRGEDYAAKRDHLSGSEAWGRNCETVAILEFAEDDDGTAPQRSLTVLPRNASAEKFTLAFEAGRLVPIQPTPEKEQNLGGRPNESLQTAITFLERELQDGPKVGNTLIREAHDFENIKRATLFKAAQIIQVNMRDRIAGKAVWSLSPTAATLAPKNATDMDGSKKQLTKAFEI